MWNGKVIGEFVCDEVYHYICDNKRIYGWHISELKIYDDPKELYSFVKPCDREYDCCVCMRWDNSVRNCEDSIINPPKSWCYVDELR